MSAGEQLPSFVRMHRRKITWVCEKPRKKTGKKEKNNTGRGEEKAGEEAPHGGTSSAESVRIDYRRYRFTRKETARYLAEGLLIGAAAVWLCYSSWAAVPAALPAAFLYLRMKREDLAQKRRTLLTLHFRDFLSSLHTALLAGYSLENGVSQAAADLERLYGKEDILCRELSGIVRRISFRTPVEELFRDLGTRSGVEDIRFFGDILVITKRTGGDLNRTLRSVWGNLCEKLDTRQEIETVAAAARYELTVMNLMPALIILYMRLTFDGFEDRMYGNPVGAAAMTAALGVYAAAFCLGRKMTQIREI